jgi:hypothetical protein
VGLKPHLFFGDSAMASFAVDTVIKMIESLPHADQDRVVEHLRDYLADLYDEHQWEVMFEKTQTQLSAAARRAKQEIEAGATEPLDANRL